MPISPLDDLLYGGRAFPIQKMREADHALYMAQIKNVEAESLDAIAQEMGQLEYPAVDENGVVRAIFSALNLIQNFGISAFLGLFNSSGAPQVWGSADDGSLAAMGGNWKVDSTGQSMTGLLFPLYFLASNEGEQRQAWLGLSVPQGGTAPVFSIIFTGPDGENLVVDGDGLDLTGWTDAESMWAVTTDNPYSDDYPSSFRHSGEVWDGTLLQNIAVTAGEIYSFGFASYMQYGILSGRALLTWKDGASAVISTDTLYGSGGAWQYSQQSYVAPAGAVTVDIEFDAGDPFNIFQITYIQLFEQSVSTEFRLSDGAMTAIVDGVEYDLLGGSSGDVLYASNARTTIDTSGSGSTNVFSVVLDANFFTDNQLVFEVDSFLDQNANNRIFTGVLTVGSKTVTIAMGGGGSNVISDWNHKGVVSKGGTNIQDISFEVSNIANATNTTPTFYRKKDNATETETGAITVSMTLSLSGNADFCYFMAVRVRKVENT